MRCLVMVLACTVAPIAPLAGCATQSPSEADRRILSRTGPLPVACDFESGGARQLLSIAGSAWSDDEGVPLVIDVVVDGSIVGQGRLFSNGPATHRALVFPAIPLTLAKGHHTLELRAGNEETTSDPQDFYEVTLTER